MSISSPIQPGELDASPAKYINSVGVSSSQWDFALQFQLHTVVGQQPDGVPIVNETLVARIVMSPQHAVALRGALSDAVKEWETKFGKLKDLRDQVERGN